MRKKVKMKDINSPEDKYFMSIGGPIFTYHISDVSNPDFSLCGEKTVESGHSIEDEWGIIYSPEISPKWCDECYNKYKRLKDNSMKNPKLLFNKHFKELYHGHDIVPYMELYHGYNSKYDYIDELLLHKKEKNSTYSFKIDLTFLPQLSQIDFIILTINVDKNDNKLKIKSNYKCYNNSDPEFVKIPRSLDGEVAPRKFDRRVYEAIAASIEDSDMTDTDKRVILKTLEKYVSKDRVWY